MQIRNAVVPLRAAQSTLPFSDKAPPSNRHHQKRDFLVSTSAYLFSFSLHALESNPNLIAMLLLCFSFFSGLWLLFFQPLNAFGSFMRSFFAFLLFLMLFLVLHLAFKLAIIILINVSWNSFFSLSVTSFSCRSFWNLFLQFLFLGTRFLQMRHRVEGWRSEQLHA